MEDVECVVCGRRGGAPRDYCRKRKFPPRAFAWLSLAASLAANSMLLADQIASLRFVRTDNDAAIDLVSYSLLRPWIVQGLLLFQTRYRYR
jgi:hypothetical protein